jgi:hypothetical protein
VGYCAGLTHRACHIRTRKYASVIPARPGSIEQSSDKSSDIEGVSQSDFGL